MDVSTLDGGPPVKETEPIQPIYTSGMAYAKIIDGNARAGRAARRASIA